MPLAIANYIFNGGLFISPNTGVSTMITQLNILYVYFVSTIKYDEAINMVCLIGAMMLMGALYVILIHK